MSRCIAISVSTITAITNGPCQEAIRRSGDGTPAYEAGAKRFTALVKKAKNQAARFGGDMKRACQRSK
jgi:hypothetical protein